MSSYIIKNTHLVNEGKTVVTDVLVKNQRIERIDPTIDAKERVTEMNGEGLILMPGIIDDQVHFREPGLTHKATIQTEARAGVAGGVTSYMEMPNVNPLTLTIDLLEEKYAIASRNSLANYSFYMGTGNHNYEELLKVDKQKVCGIKIFMGSSTGDMLVDNEALLEKIFCTRNDILIATHCEDDKLVKLRTEMYAKKYGEDIPFWAHPEIRNEEVCLNSSSLAVRIAKKCNARLHILHITTADELALFSNDIPLENKRITSEVCVHHLWFDKSDYEQLGSKIKCNPAIKEAHHKRALFEALLDDRLDVIATDHAPHTWEEKNNKYAKAPAGLPLLQHSLNMMLEFNQQGKISLEKIVEKMCHKPAICFDVKERGFVREGYFADLVLLDLNKSYKVGDANDAGKIHYKCGWSPLEGHIFKGEVQHTFVSGHLAYSHGQFNESKTGERLYFNR